MAQKVIGKPPGRMTIAQRLTSLKSAIKIGPFKTAHSARVRASQLRLQARTLGVEVVILVDAETATVRVSPGVAKPKAARAPKPKAPRTPKPKETVEPTEVQDSVD